MKLKNNIYIPLITVGLFIASFNVHGQKFTNTYKKIKTESDTIRNPKDVVGLSFISQSYIPTKNKKVNKTIFELTELAQYKLISAYSKKESKSKIFRKELVQPLEKESPVSIKIVDNSYLTIPRRFLFFVDNKWKLSEPANRISSLRISIHLKSNELRFVKFNGFVTKYEYYDFGSIEGTKSRNFSISGDVGVGGAVSNSTFDENNNQTSSVTSNVGPSANASFGLNNSVKENITIRQRTIAQTGMLSSDMMIIYIEGMPTKDLNGPITIEFMFAADQTDKQESLEFINFSTNTSGEAKVRTKHLIKPNNSLVGDIKADIEFEWIYRKVVKNGKTSFEGDDHIEYYTSNSIYYKDTIVLKSKDLEVDIFNISSNESPIFLSSKSGKRHSIRFISREEGVLFLNYINEKAVNTIGAFTIVDKTGTAISISKLVNLELEPDKF